MRYDARLQRAAHQGEVANQMECLMAAEFIRKTQRTVEYAVIVENDGDFNRAPANQTHCLSSRKILHKATSTCRGELAHEALTIHDHFLSVRADGRVRVIHEAMHPKFLRWINSDAAIAVRKFQRLCDADVGPGPAGSARSTA